MSKRSIRPKAGELKLAWSKLPHEAPDICYAWGDGCSKRDGRFLCSHFTGKIVTPNFTTGQPPYTFEPSFADELIARGYDITTIKFSIQKLKGTTP